jgi:hypothetical protein
VPIGTGACCARCGLHPFPELIQLVGAQVDITVSEDDSGRLQCVLALANFSLRKVTITALHVDYLTIGNGGLSDLNPHLEQPTIVIPRRSVGEIAFSHRLNGGEIRDLQRFIDHASYPKSSPRASTGLRGALALRNGSGVQQITFAVSGIVPLLTMYNPGNTPAA